MAEYLLKGGKMLEKTCRTCGCPLFEVKGKTFCVVCAEKETAVAAGETEGGKKRRDVSHAAARPAPAAQMADTCTCGEDHGEESCTCNDGGLAEEIAFTVHSLCERIQNEKDPEKILTLMNAVKAGAEALEVLCRL